MTDKIIDLGKMPFDEAVALAMELFDLSKPQAKERIAIIHGLVPGDIIQVKPKTKEAAIWRAGFKHLPGKHDQKRHGLWAHRNDVASSQTAAAVEKPTVQTVASVPANPSVGSLGVPHYQLHDDAEHYWVVSEAGFKPEPGHLDRGHKLLDSEASFYILPDDTVLGVTRHGRAARELAAHNPDTLKPDEKFGNLEISLQKAGGVRVWQHDDRTEIETHDVDTRTLRRIQRLIDAGKIKPHEYVIWGSIAGTENIGVTYGEFMMGKRIVRDANDVAELKQIKRFKHLPGKHDQKRHGLWAHKVEAAPAQAAPAKKDGYVAAKFQGEDAWRNMPTVQSGKDQDDTDQDYPGQRDSMLRSIAHDQGFDGPAQRVSQAEFDRMIQAGEVHEVFRGVNGPDRETIADRVKQFRDSDNPYYGSGIRGNGMYFAEKEFEARGYDGPDGKGVIRAGLRKDAKTITWDELRPMWRKVYNAEWDKVEAAADAAYKAFKANNTPEALSIFKALEKQFKNMGNEKNFMAEPGRLAALMGYDAITIPGSGHVVVLNRTALVIEE